MNTKDCFIKAFYELQKRKGCTQKEIAEFMPVAPPQLNQFLKGPRNFSEEKRERIAEFFHTSYMDMLFLGKRLLTETTEVTQKTIKDQIREVLKEETKIIDITTVKNIEHPKIIQQFKNPELASLINGDLLHLEKFNPKALKKVHNYIKFEIGQTEEDRS